jgi:hypothetical protein
MTQSGNRPIERLTRCCTLVAIGGCAPSVDLVGVYFPGWLVSVVTGVVGAYGIVIWLARRPDRKALADSGLLFLGLLVSIALVVWWIFFSGF